MDDADKLNYVGFLAFSGKFVNPDVIKTEIDNKLGNIDENLKGKIGVKLNRLPKVQIPEEHKNVEGNYFKHPLAAIYFEAADEDTHKAKNALYKIFNRGNGTNFRFRYVPANSLLVISDKGQKQYRKAWDRHINDMRDIKYITCDQIASLDTPAPNEDSDDATERNKDDDSMTLRDVLMTMDHANGSPLFHHVDIINRKENGVSSIYRFAVFPENHKEAE